MNLETISGSTQAQSTSPYHVVGKIRDAHGLKGEVFIMLFAGEAYWLKRMKTARLVNGTEVREVPVRSARFHQVQGRKGLILSSPDLKDRNEAEALKGFLLEIPKTFLVADSGDTPYLQELLGMQVSETSRGPVGEVVGFSSNNAQDLLIISTPKGEFEVPLVEDFVESIDFESKEIQMSLPIGLLGEEI